MVTTMNPAVLALLNTMGGARTITRRVALTSEIIDGQIIGATPEAVRLFGCSHSSELLGRYLSEITPAEDLAVQRDYATARQFGRPAPNNYESHLLLPDGRPRRVRKEVQQLSVGDSDFWVTQLHEADELRPYRMQHVQLDLPSADIHRFRGLTTVAGASTILSTLHPSSEINRLQNIEDTSYIQPNINNTDEIGIVDRNSDLQSVNNVEPGTLEVSLDFTSAHTLTVFLSSEILYIHLCRKCGKTFYSKTGEPERCKHCRSTVWKTGLTKWDERRQRRLDTNDKR